MRTADDQHARRLARLPIPDDAAAALCVLASGSSGNCSVLVCPAGADPVSPRRVTLIDAGLSPRRTMRLLHELGIDLYEIDDIVFTHLDTDHAHAGWGAVLGTPRCRATVRIHRRHRGRAERLAITRARTELFEDEFELGPRIVGRAMVMDHDDLGVAVLRFSVRREHHEHAGTIGFATDLGRVTDDLIDHLHGVGVLAIESNYCPRMQSESTRSAALKQRIMGGAGHLSNQECAHAVARIGPTQHTVLLHLSRECNLPELAAAGHRSFRAGGLHAGGLTAGGARPAASEADAGREGDAVGLTISTQHEPTPWVYVRAAPPVLPAAAVVARPMSLFAPVMREA